MPITVRLWEDDLAAANRSASTLSYHIRRAIDVFPDTMEPEKITRDEPVKSTSWSAAPTDAPLLEKVARISSTYGVPKERLIRQAFHQYIKTRTQ